MDYLEAPGLPASLLSEAYSGKDMSTIFRGPLAAGTNTGSRTRWPCGPAWTLCTPHSSTRREAFKGDTISGPSWDSSTILARERDRVSFLGTAREISQRMQEASEIIVICNAAA